MAVQKRKELIEFKGVTYTRWPDADERHRRVYFSPPRGSGLDQLHREVWKADRGRDVPEGHVIHHVDFDPLNNAPENLMAVTLSQHMRLHEVGQAPERMTEIRELATKWHQSPEGRKFHVELGKRSWMNRRHVGYITCMFCGEEVPTYFDNEARGERRFCSRRCARAQADREGRYDVEVECPVCGGAFTRSKYKNTPKTCSRRCGHRLRRRD